MARRSSRETAEQNLAKKASKKPAGRAMRKLKTAAAKKFPKTAQKVDDAKEKIQRRKKERVHPHRSFRRSYREDYRRELEMPGIMYHLFATFKVIFKNWRLFLPLLVIVVVLNVVLVGLMSEQVFQNLQTALDTTNEQIAGGDIGQVAKAGLLLISSITTGGLAGEDTETGMVFMVIVFLLIWLVTIYLLRQKLAGNKVKLRDGLYNAMTPLVSTFLVFLTAVVQCIPIFILIITFSAAMQTDFLATPFYALAFFVFAALMILLSGYLLSSTLIALVAVSAPGLWPMRALQAASDVMMGRRVRFILRLVAGAMALVVIWVIVMVPIIMLDMFLKGQFEWMKGFPLVPLCLNIMTCFTMIYVTAYLYLYYRWLLDFEDKEEHEAE